MFGSLCEKIKSAFWSNRSRLEKFLFIIMGFFVFAIIVLSSLVAVHYQKSFVNTDSDYSYKKVNFRLHDWAGMTSSGADGWFRALLFALGCIDERKKFSLNYNILVSFLIFSFTSTSQLYIPTEVRYQLTFRTFLEDYLRRTWKLHYQC